MKRQAIFSPHDGKRIRSSLIALLALIGAMTSLAREPTTEPLLRQETGMHTAPIKRVATDAAERWAVTASQDKTVRIWDLQSGEQVRVLRPPQDTGNEGKLYAVAISHDGATVALGGWTGYRWDQAISIYLFERSTARLTKRISGLPNVVTGLFVFIWPATAPRSMATITSFPARRAILTERLS